MENKFEKELSFIKDDNIREMTKKMLGYVAPEFFQAPASSTGKYHPEYALGEGGLYRHTCAAVGIAKDIIELEWIKDKLDDSRRDYIIAALMLHDIAKSGKCWESKYTQHAHPMLAAELIRDNIEGDEYSEFVENVCRMIESHMGQWNWSKWDRVKLPKPNELDEFIVHLCDYLASRKYLEYKFEV